MTNKSNIIPICEKVALTLEEASALSNIGINRLRKLTGEDTCDFVFYVGTKRLIKRKRFESTSTSCIPYNPNAFIKINDDRSGFDMIYYMCHTKALPAEKGD